MKTKSILLGFFFALLSIGAAAQVTTSGTTSSGYVPVFTGTTTVTNSSISIDANNNILLKGYPALGLDSNYNLAIGGTNMLSTNTGQYSVAAGSNALGSNTSGDNNTAIGAFTLWHNTTGSGSVAIGRDALTSNTTGTNIAIGQQALFYNQTGSSNNSVGWGSLVLNVTGSGNTAFGTEALYSVTGNYNSAFGGGWGSWGAGRSITTGNNNSVFGALVASTTLTSGSNNILIGTDQMTDTQSAGDNNSMNIGNTIYGANMRNNSNGSGVGNVGIGIPGPTKRLDVAGTIRTTANGTDTGGVIYPDSTQQTTAWTGVLCGGDYAEDMRAANDRKSYAPGDVLALTSDDNSDIQKSTEPYSTMVAGIYATKPGVVGLRDAVSKSTDNVPMAMVGVVPTKVTAENGSIHKGDLLVTSSQMGYAMKGTDRSKMLGAVLGKAMGSLDSGTGVIEVLVTLQ